MDFRADVVICETLVRPLEEDFKKISDKFCLSIKVLCGDKNGEQLSVYKLLQQHRDRSEADSRMVLDTILQHLCVRKKITIRTEQAITCKNNVLPTSGYNYILYDKHDRPIGVIEAKSPNGLIQDSIAQLIA